MRGRTADRIPVRGCDEQVEIGARWPKWIVAGCAGLGTSLPPAVRANRHAGIESIVDPGASAHAGLRGFDADPVAVGDSTRPRRLRMQVHLRIRGALTETRQRVMLGLAKQRG